jgi:hypothetical protein
MISNIKYLVGDKKFSSDPLEPFSKQVCNFLSKFSNELNKTKNIRNLPDIKALAFWCREKNILNLKKKYNASKNLIGLGLVFHITPSNIPTNFAYSLIFGLLSGNTNILKVPSKKFDEVDIICIALKKTIEKIKFFKNRIIIIQYKDNDLFTKYISSICDARIVWGGDKTVNELRNFKLQERSVDVAFADRYSLCFIDTNELKKLNNFEMKNFVKKFYNDTYLIDQNACSSPHLIIWRGIDDKNLKNKFWNNLYQLVKKEYNLTQQASIEKYTDLCKYIISSNEIKKIHRYENFIYRVELNNIDRNNHYYRGKWGLFFEYNLKKIDELKKIVNKKYQTLTYFGIESNLLRNFIIKNKLKGIDRIVPIGQSLDISLTWDGYDIISTLSRGIEIK